MAFECWLCTRKSMNSTYIFWFVGPRDSIPFSNFCLHTTWNPLCGSKRFSLRIFHVRCMYCCCVSVFRNVRVSFTAAYTVNTFRSRVCMYCMFFWAASSCAFFLFLSRLANNHHWNYHLKWNEMNFTFTCWQRWRCIWTHWFTLGIRVICSV